MNKKRKNRKIVIDLLGIMIIGILFAGCCINNKKNNVYMGNGIPYIIGDNGKCKLIVYNADGTYKEKIGSTEDVFWFATSINDEETLSVDNNDRIYRFVENSKEIYSNIETNIMAVLKLCEYYLVISEKEDSVYINLYKEGFTEKLDTKNVPGTFEHCFVEDDTVYYSVRGDEEQFTDVYAYCFTDNSNEQVYSSDVSQDIYPFVVDGTLFVAKNELITEFKNVDILELHERQENGEFKKVMDLNEPLIKVLIVDGEVYGLAGIQSASVLKMDLSEYRYEELFTLANEEALGLCYFDNNIQVMTSNAIYNLKGDKLLKWYNTGFVDLLNEFY